MSSFLIRTAQFSQKDCSESHNLNKSENSVICGDFDYL